MDRSSRELGEKAKKVASWGGRRRFLKKTGVGSAVLMGATRTAAAGEADNYGNKNDHYLTMSSADRDDGIQINVGWEWDPDDFGDTGQEDADIKDGVGIIYSTDRWESVTKEYKDDKHCEWDGWHTLDDEYHAVTWEYDHEGDYHDDGLEYRQCSTLLKKRPGYDKYPVQAEYHHTWNDTSINGIGLQTGPGLFVKWENEGDSWRKAYSYNDVR